MNGCLNLLKMEIEINPHTLTWPIYSFQIPIKYRNRLEEKPRRVEPVEKLQEYNGTRSSTGRNPSSINLLA